MTGKKSRKSKSMNSSSRKSRTSKSKKNKTRTNPKTRASSSASMKRPKKPGYLSEAEKQIIYLEIERSKLNREKSMLVLNKALFLYFSFLFVGVIGLINNYITKTLLNIIVLLGVAALLIGFMPYIKIMLKEDERLDNWIKKLKKML